MSQKLLERLATWIVENDDKKDTPEYATVAQAFKETFAKLTPQADVGSEEWRTQMEMQGLDVGHRTGPLSRVTTPAGAETARAEGLDIGMNPTRPVPSLPPVGTGMKIPFSLNPNAVPGVLTGKPDLKAYPPMELPVPSGAAGAIRGMARTGASLSGGRDLAERTFKRPAEATPLERGMEVGGDLAPYAALPGQLFNTPTRAAVTGGVVGLLESQGGTPAERAVSTGVGAGLSVAGHQVGVGLQEGVQRLRPAAKDLTEKMLREAEDLGFRRTRGQEQGAPRSTRLREAQLSRNPHTSDSFAAIEEHNQRLGNQLAGEQIGLPGLDTLTYERLGEAAANTGRMYDEVLIGEMIPVTDDVLDRMAAVKASALTDLPKGRQKLVDKYIDQIMDLSQSSALPGEIYNDIRVKMGQDMRRLYRSKKSSDYMQASALEDLQNVLDDAAETALPADKVTKLKQARKQWYWQLQLEHSGVVNGRGDVSLRTLHNNLSRESVSYKRGKVSTDLEKAARFAAATPQAVGDSGTATRMSKSNIVYAALGKLTGPVRAQTMGQRARQAAPMLPGVGARAGTASTPPLMDSFKELADGPLGNTGLAKSPLNPYRRNF